MLKKLILISTVLLSIIIIAELFYIYYSSTNLPKQKGVKIPQELLSESPKPTVTDEPNAPFNNNYMEEVHPRLVRNNVITSNTLDGTIVTTVYESQIDSLDLPNNLDEAHTRDNWSMALKVGEEKPVSFLFDESGFSKIKVYEQINGDSIPISIIDLKVNDLIVYTTKIDISKPLDDAFIEGTIIRKN